MSTAGALIGRVSQRLLSGTTEERNKLLTTVTSGGTSFVMTYDLAGLRAGTVFEIDSELIYIWTSTASNKTLAVERGYLGSVAATHNAGAIIYVNPRFPQQLLLDSLNSDIDDLSSPINGLYRVITKDLTYNGTDAQINLDGATSVIDLINVRLRVTSTNSPTVSGVELERNLPTDDYASTFALRFTKGLQSGTLRVVYSAPFVRAATITSDIQSVCLVPISMEDILEMGVELRMMSSREIKRNFIESQGDTRRSEEVPPGATAGATGDLKILRRNRIIAEAAKLSAQYPLQFRA